ncbi:uncharacterized protein N7503_006378 [Penicillium pulvis]|uniref:uncharacterized protein n=1 Tax=Penicillium pulvis TaxID=1562058 RepID=UPI002547267F|nr:uncharacterized protein N7503_006378 [Penicillium pulvis]KAJ5798873.1 hypothetical protein N7503_006378 [Penicillium pulvis]
MENTKVWGHRWRASLPFLMVCVSIAGFTETFSYGFIVPILPYMVEDRNHIDPSKTQQVTYLLLMCYGIVSTIVSIFIGSLLDRFHSRKSPLILSLVLTIIGTVLLAVSRNLAGMFIGRVLQAIGGTAAWIVGFATLKDAIDIKNIGKVFGVVRSCVSLGALAGPAVAGVLLELNGYWVTWGSVLLILAVDVAMRLLMVEQRKQKPNSDGQTSHDSESTDETSTLISDDFEQLSGKDTNGPTESFFKVICLQPRVITAMLCSTVYTAILASYSTTIPVHVKDAFGWGSLPTGLLFMGLEGPIILASPLYGWLRDRIGTRIPATIGFALLAPLLWLVGAADQKEFPWSSPQSSAEATYISAIVAIGFVTNLMSSVSAIEITCAVDEEEEKRPGLFGPNGGYNRTYSMSALTASAGMLVGSFLSGSLSDAIGYYYMNSVLATTFIQQPNFE